MAVIRFPPPSVRNNESLPQSALPSAADSFRECLPCSTRGDQERLWFRSKSACRRCVAVLRRFHPFGQSRSRPFSLQPSANLLQFVIWQLAGNQHQAAKSVVAEINAGIGVLNRDFNHLLRRRLRARFLDHVPPVSGVRSASSRWLFLQFGLLNAWFRALQSASRSASHFRRAWSTRYQSTPTTVARAEIAASKSCSLVIGAHP